MAYVRYSVGWPAIRLVCLLVGWSAGWLVCWLVGRSVGCSVSSLVDLSKIPKKAGNLHFNEKETCFIL